MGKGGSLSESVVKKILLSYAYVGVWIFLSFTVIVYNKYILDKKMYNWPFPISLTMIHMSFCSTFAFLLVRVFKLVKPVSMSRDLYLPSVVPNLPHQHMGAGVEARDSGTGARHGTEGQGRFDEQ